MFAIEPHPIAYEEIENIRLNGLEDKIVAINAAVGSRIGNIYVPINIDLNNVVFSYYDNASNGDFEVSMTTLKLLMQDYGIEPDILKMDREDCKYNVILNDYDSIKL